MELLIILALFIYTTAPISGGHLNPLVTIATFLGRLATFPRMVLYVVFQLLGAVIGAFLLRAALGQKLPAAVSPAQRGQDFRLLKCSTDLVHRKLEDVTLIPRLFRRVKPIFLKLSVALRCSILFSVPAWILAKKISSDLRYHQF